MIENTSTTSSTSLIYQVWRRNFLQFRRSWLINLFWIVLEPLFYLVAIGYGIGAFVNQVNGYSYVDFFFPALLCVSSMFVSFFVSSYDTFSKLTHQKIYKTMILTPISPKEIVVGEILWGATKGALSAVAVSVVAAFFGHIDSWMIFPCFIVVFISSWTFSAIGILVASWVRNYDMIIYATSGFVVPMSLFSGTYFPLDELPKTLEYLAFAFPLTHTVYVVRSLLLVDQVDARIWIHVIYLGLLAAVLTAWAVRRIHYKLIK